MSMSPHFTTRRRVLAATGAPVSYTHLDVYKRQAQQCVEATQAYMTQLSADHQVAIRQHQGALDAAIQICLLYTSRCV